MANIIWLGEKYFSDRLAECGWDRVFSYRPTDYEIYTYPQLVKLAEFVPDVIVASDFSSPPTLPGVECFPCLTVFYSVDSHIHSWHPLYAQAFDACLYSLKDHGQKFAGSFLPSEHIWWSPAFAWDSDSPDFTVQPEYECVFVGTDNENIAPKRHKFLGELASCQPEFYVTSGKYRDIYIKSKVVVNQAEHGDLNFRVFEAMGCGSALVTPLISHGLTDLFSDGKHFLGYEDGNARDANAKINLLLKDVALRDRLRRAAHMEIEAYHRAIHRAQEFTRRVREILKDDNGRNVVASRLAIAEKMRSRFLSMFYYTFASKLPQENFKRSFYMAAKGQTPTAIQEGVPYPDPNLLS